MGGGTTTGTNTVTSTSTSTWPHSHSSSIDLPARDSISNHDLGLGIYSSSPSIQVDYLKAEHGDPVSDDEEQNQQQEGGREPGSHGQSTSGLDKKVKQQDMEDGEHTKTDMGDVEVVEGMDDVDGEDAGGSRKASVSLQLFKQAAKAAAIAAKDRQRISAAQIPAAVPVPFTADPLTPSSAHLHLRSAASPSKLPLDDPFAPPSAASNLNHARSSTTSISSASPSVTPSVSTASSPSHHASGSTSSGGGAGTTTFQLQFRNSSNSRSASIVAVEATLAEMARGGRLPDSVHVLYQANPTLSQSISAPRPPSRTNSSSSLHSIGSKSSSASHTPIKLSSRSSSSYGFQDFPDMSQKPSNHTRPSSTKTPESASRDISNGNVGTSSGPGSSSPSKRLNSPTFASSRSRSRTTSPKPILRSGSFIASPSIPPSHTPSSSSVTTSVSANSDPATPKTSSSPVMSIPSNGVPCFHPTADTPSAPSTPPPASNAVGVPPLSTSAASLEESLHYTPISSLPQISTTISPSMPLRRKSFRIVSTSSSRTRVPDRGSVLPNEQLPPSAISAGDLPSTSNFAKPAEISEETGITKSNAFLAKLSKNVDNNTLQQRPSISQDSTSIVPNNNSSSRANNPRLSRRISVVPKGGDDVLPTPKEEHEYDYELDVGDRNAEGKHEGVLSPSQGPQDPGVFQPLQHSLDDFQPLSLEHHLRTLTMEEQNIDELEADPEEAYKSDSVSGDSAPSIEDEDEQQQQQPPYVILLESESRSKNSQYYHNHN